MGMYYFEGIGWAHLNEAKRPKVVPVDEKHRWDCKPEWGQSATCVQCGCVKHKRKSDYVETFQMPGGAVVTDRPTCTGNPKKVARKKAQLSIFDT
jgi:hypothetical protein